MEKILLGHTTQDTAYLVDDYPYGRSIRCRIRYWLEEDKKHGFRFCHQTENPKTLRWNAAKKSTYQRFAAAMFLDDKGHVTWKGVHEYSDVKDIKDFLKRFPDSPCCKGVRVLARAKARYVQKCLTATHAFTINGVPQMFTEHDRENQRAELAEWSEILESDFIGETLSE